MTKPVTERKESRAEATDRIARSIISQEQNRIRSKSDRLREMRLKAEQMASA